MTPATCKENFGTYGHVTITGQGGYTTAMLYIRHPDPRIVYPFKRFYGGTVNIGLKSSIWRAKGKTAASAAAHLVEGNQAAMHLFPLWKAVHPHFIPDAYNDAAHNLESSVWEQFAKLYPEAPIPVGIPMRHNPFGEITDLEKKLEEDLMQNYGGVNPWKERNTLNHPPAKRGKRYQ